MHGMFAIKRSLGNQSRQSARRWKVVADPSGDFLGAFFREDDIEKGTGSGFERGTVFENIVTHKRVRVTGFAELVEETEKRRSND
jgi:hypothetical protein